MLYAIDPRGMVRADPDSIAHKLATAENAVRYAIMAVEASGEPVKIEVEIVHGHPATVLTRASRSAAMICVGACGSLQFARKGVGSTASAEARVRRAPLRALTTARGRLDRQLAPWIRRYPDADIRPVTLQGTIVDYLAEHARSVKLVVVGSDGLVHANEAGSPAGRSVLHDTDCPLLIVGHNCDGYTGRATSRESALANPPGA
ncbi:hypothetical protein B586_16795 [Mycobacterium haemophilum DSM 44634]|uniref:hypothetical protein n=1 Tax=Mycobacterium haemophilum TaxID=29311 RepID=UPI0006D41936|nr:hypothetical protein B586_16795 [Mycobacterium haemophilum DSM 44634]